MKTTLEAAYLETLALSLSRANAEFLKSYPDEVPARQPVHTVYGGAHLFKSGTTKKLGQLALKAWTEHAPDAKTLSSLFGMAPAFAEKVHPKIGAKLAAEAVEDFRIDFEDGYGYRSDAEEDGHALSAAAELAAALAAKELPPFVGIRIKSLSDDLFPRAARTLDLFLTALLETTAGRLPDNFVITIPKVSTPEQITLLGQLLSQFEMKALLPAGVLKIELMVESPQALIGRTGQCMLPLLVKAGEGRCVAAHFGAYDFLSAFQISAAVQSLSHPRCDFARHLMQTSLAGTGVRLSDGATTVMPVAGKVNEAWREIYGNVGRALNQGFYQGWDLHPAQIPARYAAHFTFFVEGLAQSSLRFEAFLERSAKATLTREFFDDAATGQGLLNFFSRGRACGALEVSDLSSINLTADEWKLPSLLRILNRRKKNS